MPAKNQPLQSRIKRAGFPTDATLESYDWTRNPKTIRREPFLELATGEFIRPERKRCFRWRKRLGKNTSNARSREKMLCVRLSCPL